VLICSHFKKQGKKMKKEKVLRTKRVVVYLTVDELISLDRAIEKSRLPRTEAIRNFLLSSTYEHSAALSK
jgi:hypothetical protein